MLHTRRTARFEICRCMNLTSAFASVPFTFIVLFWDDKKNEMVKTKIRQSAINRGANIFFLQETSF